jgi:hypothetical protein
LPVEVWSQFMKVAHKGKLPSDLPGDATATATTVPNPAPGPPPRRREAREAREAMRPVDPPGDDWFMQRWFLTR